MDKDFEKIIEHLNSDTVSNDEKVKLYKAPSFQGLVLKELVQAFYEEKQDCIKSDNSARHYNIAIIVISSLTLAATIATVIIGVLTMLG